MQIEVEQYKVSNSKAKNYVLQSQVHSLLSAFNTHDFYSVLFYLFNFDQRSKKHLALLKWSRDLSLKKRFNQPENQINPNTKYDTDVCYTPLLECHQGSHWLSAKPGRSGEFSSFQYPTFDHWHLNKSDPQHLTIIISIRSVSMTSVWQFGWLTGESLNKTFIPGKHIASMIIRRLLVMM